ncbi:hypothetical protein EMMF5_004268 [Cystobasidiomycetes sp. EMM_F5]
MQASNTLILRFGKAAVGRQVRPLSSTRLLQDMKHSTGPGNSYTESDKKSSSKKDGKDAKSTNKPAEKDNKKKDHASPKDKDKKSKSK